jgi:hypothetical protein
MHFAIDHAEQGPEEPPELAVVEDTNPEEEQGKPPCINQWSLSFTCETCFMFLYDCALSS